MYTQTILSGNMGGLSIQQTWFLKNWFTMCSVFSNVYVYLTYIIISPIFTGQIQCKERQTIEGVDWFWQYVLRITFSILFQSFGGLQCVYEMYY